MQPTQCGTGVAPGTYLAAGMVFEGSIQDIVSDNGDLYILDQKYVWKTNALMTLFTAVIGTQANLGAAVDGTDGLSYTLSTPLSLAKRNNVMVIGEVNRVLRFDTTGTNTFDGSLLIGSSPVPGDPLTTLQATDTTVAHVSALAFYDDDTVLVAEQYRDIVRYISLSAMTVTPIAGKEWVDAPPYLDSANTPISSTSARLFDPVDIVVGNNAVYVAQGGYGLIHRLN